MYKRWELSAQKRRHIVNVTAMTCVTSHVKLLLGRPVLKLERRRQPGLEEARLLKSTLRYLIGFIPEIWF